jgi:2,4-dienoyl-CoA reductase-like NADH-dependent reductase (Old Yellow Enzyme family)
MTADLARDVPITKLVEPVQMGPLTVPNRIVMAPLTRSRIPRWMKSARQSGRF